MGYLQTLGVWNWFILAGILIVLEVLVPGTFLLWLGLAAIATGVVGLAVELSWQIQVLLFAIFAIVAVVIARRIAPKPGSVTDSPFLNRRPEGFVGRVFVLEEGIVSGTGRARIDDTLWRVRGPDCPAGTRVRVERAEGTMLFVTPAP